MIDLLRVLSIDGGGIRGTFAAAFLAEIETKLSEPIGHYFDLAVGTSTGGIIVLGLGSGHTAQEILSFYHERGPNVFTQSRRRPIQAFGPKYDMDKLGEELTAIFSDKRLGDSKIRLAIPTYQVNSGRSVVYRTPHHPDDAHNHPEARFVNVALATAALPVVFRPFLAEDGTAFVDGGLYAVNPVALSVVEAIGTLRWPTESVRVLSIGSTTSEVSVNLAELNRGIASFYRNPGIYIDMIARAQSSFSEQVARTLLSSPDHIVRVNPVVAPGQFALDSLSALPELEALGRAEANRLYPLMEDWFSIGTAQPYNRASYPS